MLYNKFDCFLCFLKSFCTFPLLTLFPLFLNSGLRYCLYGAFLRLQWLTAALHEFMYRPMNSDQTFLMAHDYPCDLQQVLLHRRNFDVEHAPFRLSFHLICDKECSETSIYVQLHFCHLLREVSIPRMTADRRFSVGQFYFLHQLD